MPTGYTGGIGTMLYVYVSLISVFMVPLWGTAVQRLDSLQLAHLHIALTEPTQLSVAAATSRTTQRHRTVAATANWVALRLHTLWNTRFRRRLRDEVRWNETRRTHLMSIARQFRGIDVKQSKFI